MLLQSQVHWALWQELMEELLQLAHALGVPLSTAAIGEAQAVVRSFPSDSRSSFQRDVAQGIAGEKEVLIDEVIAKSRQQGLSADRYESMEVRICKNIQKNSKTTG